MELGGTQDELLEFLVTLFGLSVRHACTAATPTNTIYQEKHAKRDVVAAFATRAMHGAAAS
eukprot:SAG11_NODE_1743_length_4335_cov_1.760387_4_plen_61_part_00